jgi:hypothetical protein
MRRWLPPLPPLLQPPLQHVAPLPHQQPKSSASNPKAFPRVLPPPPHLELEAVDDVDLLARGLVLVSLLARHLLQGLAVLAHSIAPLQRGSSESDVSVKM